MEGRTYPSEKGTDRGDNPDIPTNMVIVGKKTPHVYVMTALKVLNHGYDTIIFRGCGLSISTAVFAAQELQINYRSDFEVSNIEIGRRNNTDCTFIEITMSQQRNA